MCKVIKYDEDLIVSMYAEGNNTKYIADLLGTYNTTIRRILIRNHVKLRSSADVWDKRELLFDGTDEADYWIGFLAADGALFKDNKIALTLSSKDKSHVELFSKFCKSNIKKIVDKRFNCVLYMSYFRSKKNADYLKSIGITECKSFTLCLKIPINRSIFRGVLDGDGYVRQNGLSSIATASIDFKSQLSEFLTVNSIKHTVCKNSNVYIISINSFKENVKLFELLYKDASIFLKRKKDRMRSAYMKI